MFGEKRSSAATSDKSYTANVIISVVRWVCFQRELTSDFGLLIWINRTNALASNCTRSKNSSTQQLSLAQIEIPSGLASSPAATGLEPISGTSTDQESANCSIAPALLNVRDYKDLRCSLQVYWLALPMHHAGFSHHALWLGTNPSPNTVVLNGKISLRHCFFFPSEQSSVAPTFFQQWFKRHVLRSASEVAKLLESIPFHWWAHHKSLLWPRGGCWICKKQSDEEGREENCGLLCKWKADSDCLIFMPYFFLKRAGWQMETNKHLQARPLLSLGKWGLNTTTAPSLLRNPELKKSYLPFWFFLLFPSHLTLTLTLPLCSSSPLVRHELTAFM